MDTPPSKSSEASKALKHARAELKVLQRKMSEAQENDEKLFASLKRLKKAREKTLAGKVSEFDQQPRVHHLGSEKSIRKRGGITRECVHRLHFRRRFSR